MFKCTVLGFCILRFRDAGVGIWILVLAFGITTSDKHLFEMCLRAFSGARDCW